VVGFGTTYGALIMMMQTFLATISFSIGLLAFCAGAWLTIWATSSNNHVTDVAAAKLTGYFITVLSIVALVFTSYFITIGILENSTPMPSGKWTTQEHVKHMQSNPPRS
jgi:hypothetical protein